MMLEWVLPPITLTKELNPYSQENLNKLLWTPMKIVKKHYMNNSSTVDAKLRAMLTQVPQGSEPIRYEANVGA